MPESPPPGVAEDAAVGPSQALSPAGIAAILTDFHNWLTALAVSPPAALPAPSTPPGPDLATLLGQMTALRQEVNLQTRAVRAQQEQNGQTLQQLGQAVELLQSAPAISPAEEPVAEETVRPLLKTLVDLYDALSLASREIARVRGVILPMLHLLAGEEGAKNQLPEFSLPPQTARTWWQRWLSAPNNGENWKEAITNDLAEWQKDQDEKVATATRQRQETIAKVRQALASLVTGYSMGLQRIERALLQHGLEPIVTVGVAFDPEEMEVVEAVRDSSLTPGEVAEEVRRGYRWNGRIFRYAQVRVASG